MRLHLLGTDVADDVELFGEGHGPETVNRVLRRVRNGRYMVYTVQHRLGADRCLRAGSACRRRATAGRRRRPGPVQRPLRPGRPVAADESGRTRRTGSSRSTLADPDPDPANVARRAARSPRTCSPAYQVIGDRIYADYLHNVEQPDRAPRHVRDQDRRDSRSPKAPCGDPAALAGRHRAVDAHLAHHPVTHPRDRPGDPRDHRLAPLGGPVRRRRLRSQPALVHLARRYPGSPVRRPPQGARARWRHAGAALRLRRLQRQPPAPLRRPRGGVDGAGRGLRHRDGQGRRRVRRDLAPCRHDGEQAQRLRRLHRGGRVAHRERLHQSPTASRSGGSATAGCSWPTR